MNYKIRRRRFGQLAIATTAAAALLGKFPKKSLAQNGPTLYGVSFAPKTTVTQGLTLRAVEVTETDQQLQLNELSAPAVPEQLDQQRQTLVQNLTGAVSDQAQTAVLDQAQAIVKPTQQPSERISSLTSLSDNTIIIVTNSATTTQTVFSSLTFVGTSTQNQKVIQVSGLAQNSTVESLLATNDDNLLSIVSLNRGIPPFRLATIDRQTGGASFIDDFGLVSNGSLPPPGTFVLPLQRKFNNLTQDTKGIIYGTSLGREGYTTLIQIDLNQRQLLTLTRLTFNGRPLYDDLASLAWSPKDQKLYALGDPNYQGTNSLLLVDVGTGALTQPTKLAVDKITFARQ